MPSWELVCAREECGATDFLACASWKDREAMMPVHCGKPMEIDYRTYRQAVEVFDSYDTKNIHPEGENIHVRSKTHLRQLETQYGVRRMDDPGVEYRGGELRKKEKTGTVYI